MRFPFATRSFLRVGFVVLAGVAACGVDSATQPAVSNPATETYASSLGVNISAMTKISDALYTQDLAVGTGTAAATGKTVTVTYSGWFTNGTQFDSNVGKAPFSFKLGIGQVIPGWDQGLVGMRAGGKRLLVIGSALGYGSNAYQNIPGGSTLVFSVQLTAVQ